MLFFSLFLISFKTVGCLSLDCPVFKAKQKKSTNLVKKCFSDSEQSREKYESICENDFNLTGILKIRKVILATRKLL